jgi:hypothetical protein
MRIGIDFDNTIIGYDEVFLAAARERGLVGHRFQGRKQAIRDAIRLLPDGELAWQHLQGHVYGQGIGGALLFEGVAAFLRRCRFEQRPVAIVSHKTEYGHHDPTRVSLRQVALDWMRIRGVVGVGEFSVPIEQIYFEDTRAAKLARIAAVGCTHFIDDLEEVLTDPAFPADVNRILFSEQTAAAPDARYVVCPTWRHIEEQVFGNGG